MIRFLGVVFRSAAAAPQSRRQLVLENLALRHQLSVLQVASHRRLQLTNLDRAFWTILRRRWSEWKRALALADVGPRLPYGLEVPVPIVNSASSQPKAA